MRIAILFVIGVSLGFLIGAHGICFDLATRLWYRIWYGWLRRPWPQGKYGWRPAYTYHWWDFTVYKCVTTKPDGPTEPTWPKGSGDLVVDDTSADDAMSVRHDAILQRKSSAKII
jgi:hypothetical protein